MLKRDNKWYSIDNELLDISLTGFDLGKPINGICKTDEQREAYIKAYNEVLPIDYYLRHKDFYQLAYFIKSLRSRLEHKKLPADRAYRMIRELVR